MSEKPRLGNASDELGQHEAGADFGSINQAGEPPKAEDIEVTAQREGSHIIMRPRSDDFRRDMGQFEEGPREMMDAVLFEDRTMMTPAAQRHLAKRKSQRGMLTFFAVSGSVAAAPPGDRIIIRRDTMESAYSCSACKGKGHTKEVCPTCKGSQQETFNGSVAACRSCKVLGYGAEIQHCCGHVKCESCNGSGWEGGVVKPEITQSEPCWGIVVACGPECVDIFIGDRVQYSRYAGHTNTFKSGDVYTTMHEHEVLWHLKEL